MEKNWGRPLWLVFALFSLLIPGVRRFVFFRLLRNPMIRNMGIKFILALPFVRERLMNQFIPSPQKTKQPN